MSRILDAALRYWQKMPPTIRRGTLQNILLAIWLIGGLSCFFLIQFSRVYLSDKRLGIDELKLLDRYDPGVATLVRQAKQGGNWHLLRKLFAERATKKLFETWGTEEPAVFLGQLSPIERGSVGVLLSQSRMIEDWDSVAGVLMPEDIKKKIGSAKGDWNLLISTLLPEDAVSIERESRIAELYDANEKALVALFAPWIAVMLSACLFGEAQFRKQRVEQRPVLIVLILSTLFLGGLMYAFWSRLYLSPDPAAPTTRESRVDLLSPVIAWLATLIGTTITFTFPEAKDTGN